MVKIAIAGGSSAVAREIIDVLVAAKQHDITVLSRKNIAKHDPGISHMTTDYSNSHDLAKTLQGFDTVLSFIDPNLDKDAASQKCLIDAAIIAGVKRFAPSEWSSSSLDHMPWYESKGIVRDYLRKLNEKQKVLEYTLFQPGLLANYFTHPYDLAKHLPVFQLPIDFNNRRALIVDGCENARITLTTVQDLARVVARAVIYEGQWPTIGGIKGTELSISQLITLGEKIRGSSFSIEKLASKDLQSGELNATWTPQTIHPSTPPDVRPAVAALGTRGFLLATSSEAFNVTSDWNHLLPDFQFTELDEFLAEAWDGKN